VTDYEVPELSVPHLTLQDGEPPPVSCSRLLTQHICSYLPYLETIPPFTT